MFRLVTPGDDSRLAPIETTDALDTIELGIDDLEPLSFEGLAPPRVRERTKLTTHQATEQYGKKDSSHLVKQEKTKAALANRELIRRLMQDPTQFKTGELNFIAGTAVDKVAKRERWDRAGEDTGISWMEQFVTAFSKLQAQSGMKVSLEVVNVSAKKAEEAGAPFVDVEVRALPQGEDVGTLP